MSRQRNPVILAAVPLVLAALLATALLWSRSTPDGGAGYCVRATVAVTDLLRAGQRPGESSSSLVALLDSGTRRLDLLDVSPLVDDSPQQMRSQVIQISDLIAKQRRAVAEARNNGEPPPESTPQLSRAFTDFFASYIDECLA